MQLDKGDGKRKVSIHTHTALLLKEKVRKEGKHFKHFDVSGPFPFPRVSVWVT